MDHIDEKFGDRRWWTQIGTPLHRQQSKQEELTAEEEMKPQQRMVIMKDLIRKIISKERMDAKNRWWVSEFLAADCEKAWVHTGWEDTLQQSFYWLEEMKKKDEKKDGGHASPKRHDLRVPREVLDSCTKSRTVIYDKEFGGQCWASAQDHETYSMERRNTDPEKG